MESLTFALIGIACIIIFTAFIRWRNSWKGSYSLHGNYENIKQVGEPLFCDGAEWNTKNEILPNTKGKIRLQVLTVKVNQLRKMKRLCKKNTVTYTKMDELYHK